MPPYASRNFSKINFEIAYFLHFCKLKLSQEKHPSALSARQSDPCTIIATSYMGPYKYGKCYYAIKPIME